MPKLIKNDDKFIFNRHTRFGRPRSVVYYYYFFVSNWTCVNFVLTKESRW